MKKSNSSLRRKCEKKEKALTNAESDDELEKLMKRKPKTQSNKKLIVPVRYRRTQILAQNLVKSYKGFRLKRGLPPIDLASNGKKRRCAIALKTVQVKRKCRLNVFQK